MQLDSNDLRCPLSVFTVCHAHGVAFMFDSIEEISFSDSSLRVRLWCRGQRGRIDLHSGVVLLLHRNQKERFPVGPDSSTASPAKFCGSGFRAPDRKFKGTPSLSINHWKSAEGTRLKSIPALPPSAKTIGWKKVIRMAILSA